MGVLWWIGMGCKGNECIGRHEGGGTEVRGRKLEKYAALRQGEMSCIRPVVGVE